MYFFANLIYNEYIRPYFVSHVVSTIFASDPLETSFSFIMRDISKRGVEPSGFCLTSARIQAPRGTSWSGQDVSGKSRYYPTFPNDAHHKFSNPIIIHAIHIQRRIPQSNHTRHMHSKGKKNMLVVSA